MHRTLIKLVGVGKQYGREYVVKDIDLEVLEGDYIVIMGRSGVGKTSLLRVMSLLSIPDEGEVYFMGGRVDWRDESWRSGMRARYFGVLFQGDILISTLTAYENILLAYRVRGLPPNDEEIDSLMDRLGVRHLRDRYPESFSAGEYRRIGIIRALVGGPKIIILDEPYANISTDYTLIINEILREKNREGTTVIMTTAELDRRPEALKTYLLQDATLKPVLNRD